MATGDSADMLKRLRSLIPAGWFKENATYQTAVLGGLADSLAWIYSLLAVVRSGMRRSTTTGWLVDLDAFAFFGSSLLRRLGETDGAWGARWRAEVFRPRVTRAAIDKALYDLTGRHPIIIEMWNGADVGGGYGVGGLCYGGGNPVAPRVGGYGSAVGGYGAGSEGYGVLSNPVTASKGAGRWGSLSYPFQLFITAYRPMQGTIPNVGGYGSSVSGYGTAGGEYTDIGQVQSVVTDAEIYATVARVVAAGPIPWVCISN